MNQEKAVINIIIKFATLVFFQIHPKRIKIMMKE